MEQHRKRSVKCGEERPECQRCINFGIRCDGYPSPPKKIVHPKILATPSAAVEVEGRTIHLDMLATPYTSATFIRNATYPKLLVVPRSVLKFEDEMEERHFSTFQRETAAELAGVFDSTFWDRVLMQACLEDQFTLKLVMALAAMSTSRNCYAVSIQIRRIVLSLPSKARLHISNIKKRSRR